MRHYLPELFVDVLAGRNNPGRLLDCREAGSENATGNLAEIWHEIEQVFVARPTGVGRAISTYTIPIEGRDEWLAAARRLA